MIVNTYPAASGEEYNRAIVSDFNIQDSYNLDTDILKIRQAMPDPTPENCAWAFWNESVSQSFVYLSAAVMIGHGWKVTCTKKSIAQKVEKIINGFNRSINFSGDTIFDYMRDEWVDNCVHGYSVWRMLKNKDAEYGMVMDRVDPLTLEKVQDPVNGYSMFIQNSDIYQTPFKSKSDFYKNYDPLNHRAVKNVWVKIPIEPNVILYSKHYHQPPVRAALKYMIYKLWILKFMRKYAEKFWAPLIIGLIGDPGKYIPRKKTMKDISDKLKSTFKNIHNFSSMILPGYIRFEDFSPASSGKAAQVFVDYINMLDAQIMYSFGGSMATRSASGNELATQRGIREEQHMSFEGVRTDRDNQILNMYCNALLPANGIHNVTPADLKIHEPPMIFESFVDMCNGISTLGENKTINKKEARDILRSMYPQLPEGNDEGEIVASTGFSSTSNPNHTKDSRNNKNASK